MKKIALLFSCALAVFATQAQVTLTGTSYVENFDGIGSALPTGWGGRTNVTATTLGDAATFAVAAKVWQDNAGAFKNSASATGLVSSTNVADQNAASNRVF